jgi:hypothetical protein
VIAAASVVLVGCATPSPNPLRSHPPTAPTPTSTPVTASAPGSRVPVGCAELLDHASWQDLAGETARVDHDENTAPTDIPSIAQFQYGALSCDWDGLYGNSAASPGSELQIDVAPDARSEFENSFTAIMADQSASSHPTATENVAGDRSGYWCATNLDANGADANLPICEAEMLVSNYWVSIEISTVNKLSRAQLTAGLTTALTEIAAKLRAAVPPTQQWVLGAATPPGFCTDPASTASVRAIFGDPTLDLEKMTAPLTDASSVGLVRPYARCYWNTPSYGYVWVDLLGGGSWAIPTLSPVATGDSPFAGQTYTPLAVAGATSAKAACTQGACNAYLAVGTTAVNVSWADLGTAKNIAALGAFAKAVAAS